MLQKSNRTRVLEQFFDKPRHSFLIRELSRKTGLAQTAVKNHLKQLIEDKLVTEEKNGLYPTYIANILDKQYRLLKKQNMIIRLTTLIEHIEIELNPNCIVLYGSASRGEDISTSDIDIFVQARESDLDLGNYEKELNRKINIFFEEKLDKLNKELLNNLINGIVLEGYLKVL